jgi:hypothetical protein
MEKKGYAFCFPNYLSLCPLAFRNRAGLSTGKGNYLVYYFGGVQDFMSLTVQFLCSPPLNLFTHNVVKYWQATEIPSSLRLE